MKIHANTTDGIEIDESNSFVNFAYDAPGAPGMRLEVWKGGHSAEVHLHTTSVRDYMEPNNGPWSEVQVAPYASATGEILRINVRTRGAEGPISQALNLYGELGMLQEIADALALAGYIGDRPWIPAEDGEAV